MKNLGDTENSAKTVATDGSGGRWTKYLPMLFPLDVDLHFSFTTRQETKNITLSYIIQLSDLTSTLSIFQSENEFLSTKWHALTFVSVKQSWKHSPTAKTTRIIMPTATGVPMCHTLPYPLLSVGGDPSYVVGTVEAHYYTHLLILPLNLVHIENRPYVRILLPTIFPQQH